MNRTSNWRLQLLTLILIWFTYYLVDLRGQISTQNNYIHNGSIKSFVFLFNVIFTGCSAKLLNSTNAKCWRLTEMLIIAILLRQKRGNLIDTIGIFKLTSQKQTDNTIALNEKRAFSKKAIED